MKSSSPLVIPIFIPHQGCPHLCLFCNQKGITGKDTDTKESVETIGETIEEWLSRSRANPRVEVAFYGGSFTCLPISYQKKMLGAVAPFLRRGDVDGIRLSTRPDCIDLDICNLLLEHGVCTVELGVQSLDDHVLSISQRGHDGADCRRAVSHLSRVGLQVGIQLMPGLPGETTNSFLRTVRKSIALCPSFVRLYPALVVANSGLAEMYEKGEYVPLTLNKAIALTLKARQRFEEANIPVVRMGLQPSTSLEGELLAGPYHPAFGELVISRGWFKRVRKLLSGCPEASEVEIQISPKDLSAFIGPRKLNYKRLDSLGLLHKMNVVTTKDQERGTLHHVIS